MFFLEYAFNPVVVGWAVVLNGRVMLQERSSMAKLQ
jgi:hypothetical protein